MVSESFAATSSAIRSASLRESHPRKMVSAMPGGVNVTPFRRGFHLAEQCKSLSRFLVVESIEGFHSHISLER